jgi:hypothetical protein
MARNSFANWKRAVLYKLQKQHGWGKHGAERWLTDNISIITDMFQNHILHTDAATEINKKWGTK